jgi:hypothetical protein
MELFKAFSFVLMEYHIHVCTDAQLEVKVLYPYEKELHDKKLTKDHRPNFEHQIIIQVRLSENAKFLTPIA